MNASEHQLYHIKVADWTDFVKSIRDRLKVCSDTSGDIHALEAQLQRLQVNQHNKFL